MKNSDRPEYGWPLLYYRTREDIETYARQPVEAKLAWLQAQMEFFFGSMQEEAKRVRELILGPAVGTGAEAPVTGERRPL